MYLPPLMMNIVRRSSPKMNQISFPFPFPPPSLPPNVVPDKAVSLPSLSLFSSPSRMFSSCSSSSRCVRSCPYSLRLQPVGHDDAFIRHARSRPTDRPTDRPTQIDSHVKIICRKKASENAHGESYSQRQLVSRLSAT